MTEPEHPEGCLHCDGYNEMMVINCRKCGEEIFSVSGKDTELAAIYIAGELFMVCKFCEYTKCYVWSDETGAPRWEARECGTDD